MASRINADSSNGLQLVSDSSGEIQFQSSGVTVATINSSGLSMTGGKTVSGVDSLSTASGSAPSYSARAWVTFTGNVNPIVILASGNVSSITDFSAGNYQMNFTTAMPDANFCTQFMAQPTASNAGSDTFAISPTTTHVEIRHFEAGVNRDGNYCCAVVFR